MIFSVVKSPLFLSGLLLSWAEGIHCHSDFDNSRVSSRRSLATGTLGAPKAIIGSPPGQEVSCSCSAHNCNFNPVSDIDNVTIQQLRGAGNLPVPSGRCMNCLTVSNSLTHFLSSSSLIYRFQDNATCSCPEGSVLTVATAPSNVLDVDILEGEVIQSGPGAAYIIGPTNLTACYSTGQVCGNCFQPSPNCWARGAPGLGFCDDTTLEDRIVLYEESSLSAASTAIKITDPSPAGIVMVACCDNAQVAGDFGATPVSNCTTAPLTTATPVLTISENSFVSANLTNAPCALLETMDGQVCFNSFCVLGTVAMACAAASLPQAEFGCPAGKAMLSSAVGFASLTKGHQLRSPRRFSSIIVEDYGCMVGDENQVTFVPESCGSGRISTSFDSVGTSSPMTPSPTAATTPGPTGAMPTTMTLSPTPVPLGGPANVSALCLAETALLLANPFVANQILQVELIISMIECTPTLNVPPNTFSQCDADFETLKTAFVSGCTQGGGNTAVLDITMRCDLANGDANTYEMNDYPLCFSPSCGTPSPLCSGSGDVCDAPSIRPTLDGLFLVPLQSRFSGGATCTLNRALGGFLTNTSAAPSTPAPSSNSTAAPLTPVPTSQAPTMLSSPAPSPPSSVVLPTAAPVVSTPAPVVPTPAPAPQSPQQACIEEAQALATNPALTGISLPASDALFDAENCDFSSNFIVCTLDYNPFLSTVQSACVAAGGQFFSSSASLRCNVVGQSGQGFEYNLRNFPSCTGASCDVDQLLSQSGADLVSTKQEIEGPGDIVCNDPVVTQGDGLGGGGGSGACVAWRHSLLVLASLVLGSWWL